MSETVSIALITAGAGFFGALLGAVGAVIGPWWVRRSDRLAEAEANRRTERRDAIVEYVDAQVALTGVIDDVDRRKEASRRANASLTLLTSRLEPGEKPVDDWLHGLGTYAVRGLSAGYRQMAFGTAGRMLLAWHRGDISMNDLKPYLLHHSGGMIVRDSWPSKQEVDNESKAHS